MSKLNIYLMGFLTLLMAPLAWLLCGMPSIATFLKWEEIWSVWSGIGIQFGTAFGIFMFAITNNEEARTSFSPQYQLIKSLRLNLFDILFLSLCAGIGEELLFRVAIQQWVHPLIAALGFVAIHGYINPTDWQTTKYGLVITFFIVILSYAITGPQGLWFCVFAHAAYDFVLFYFWSRD